NSDFIMYQNAYSDGVVTQKDLSRAQKNLNLANEKYKKVLQNSKLISEKLEETINNKSKNNSEIKKMTLEMNELRNSLLDAIIVAPTDGKLKNLNAKIGLEVKAGEELFAIVPKK
ncbi:hypothetical protein IJ670_00235, partial [bacterium]|nr:hypothetical protein [bacterium]